MPGRVPRTTRKTAWLARSAAQANAAIWSALLRARRPSPGSIRTAVTSIGSVPVTRRKAVDDHRGHPGGAAGIVALRRGEVLPADDADLASGAQTHVLEDSIEMRRRFPRLPHEAESLEELDLQRQPRNHGVDDPLVADEEHAPFAWSQQQERLFEAGIEPGQEEEIGAVLAVAVDGNPRRARPRQRLIAAPFVFGRIDRGRFRRRDLVGQRHMTQDDVGHPHDPPSDRR